MARSQTRRTWASPNFLIKTFGGLFQTLKCSKFIHLRCLPRFDGVIYSFEMVGNGRIGLISNSNSFANLFVAFMPTKRPAKVSTFYRTHLLTQDGVFHVQTVHWTVSTLWIPQWHMTCRKGVHQFVTNLQDWILLSYQELSSVFRRLKFKIKTLHVSVHHETFVPAMLFQTELGSCLIGQWR